MTGLQKKKAKVKQAIINFNDDLIKKLDTTDNQHEYDKAIEDYLDDMTNKIFEVLEIKE